MKSARQQKKAQTNDGWNWNQSGSCIYGNGGAEASSKVAAFDMDWTLIRTKSGATFPKGKDDWLLWEDCVATKLQELEKDGYKIVIFSNQGGIGTGNTQPSDIKTKIQNIAQTCGVKIQAFLSTKEDIYKKPAMGMWDLFTSQCNDGVKVDLKKSYYVGDAAGRKPPQVKKKDFSDSDLKFGLAVGVQFKTPEQFFLGEKSVIKPSGFDPKKIKSNGQLFENKDDVATSDKQEMIIFCGSSSSGKSTFCTTHLTEYERVNRDTLKTKEKCYKVAEAGLKAGKSVVIDNTSPSVQDRAYFLKLAQQYKVPARCFYFKCEKDMCFFLNEQRVVNSGRTHLSGKVPKIPIHSFFKNHEPPKTSEGFEKVQVVKFVPGPFKSEQDEKMFYIFGK